MGELKINTESKDGGRASGSGFIKEVNTKVAISVLVINIIILALLIVIGYILYTNGIKSESPMLVSALGTAFSAVIFLFLLFLNTKFKTVEKTLVEFQDEIGHVRAFEMANSERMNDIEINYKTEFGKVNTALATIMANQSNTHDTLKDLKMSFNGNSFVTKEFCDMMHKNKQV